MIRRCALLASLIVGGCASPAEQPEVTVTINGLGTAIAAASFPGQDDVSVTLYLTPAGNDAGPASADAGTAGTVRRVISWTHSDPFTYRVQLPDAPFSGVHLEATTLVLDGCPGGMPGVLLLAQGDSATAVRPSFDTPAFITVHATAAPPHLVRCP